MSGWDTWDEKQKEYHKSNEKKREACVKRAKCCFICGVPKTETRNKEEDKPYIFLSSAHLDHDPWNPRARMEALCQDCHNKWDADERSMNAKITNNQKKEEEHGQTLTSIKVTGDQEKLKRKNRKIRRNMFVDTEWRMRNQKRHSKKDTATSQAADQLQLFVENEDTDEYLLCMQVDFSVSQFVQSVPLVQSIV